ncbi:hypothetical protein [Chromobacterium haemolyticum]|uniref:hypothetical protein n=1 Tax=Chromobacterium haemolyticum TaxID=394935 RepID=UPI0009DA750E|nr:hypothetical protein [Chromobacterium haemolyticum]OQS41863.1 hypothetical protein B0T39_07990 [Chromobacterium haemolyticum]
MKTEQILLFYQRFLDGKKPVLGLTPQAALASLNELMQWEPPAGGDAKKKPGEPGLEGTEENEGVQRK